jgi:hypothetical protein
MNIFKPKEIPPMLRLKFVPALDITAYELAFICSKCSPHRKPIFIAPDAWNGLGPDIQRHFQQCATDDT